MSNKYKSDDNKNFFYGNPQIELIWHGEWSDPELRYDDKLFNYWDIEGGLVSIFLEDNPGRSLDEPIRSLNENMSEEEYDKALALYDETEKMFAKFVQEYGAEYCDEVIAGGYFKNSEIVEIANINRVLNVAEDMGWGHYDASEPDRHIYEFSRSSPAGEDFSFSAEYDGSAEDLCEVIDDFYYSFSSDDHAGELYEAGQGGFQGVPDLAVLVEDALSIEEMLSELSTACSGVSFAEKMDDLTTPEQMAAATKWEAARVEASGCNIKETVENKEERC